MAKPRPGVTPAAAAIVFCYNKNLLTLQVQSVENSNPHKKKKSTFWLHMTSVGILSELPIKDICSTCRRVYFCLHLKL
jgi:hypothetical protein